MVLDWSKAGPLLLVQAPRGRGKLYPVLARTTEAGGGETPALLPNAILGGPSWRRCG